MARRVLILCGVALLCSCGPPGAYLHVVEGNHRYKKGDFVGATIAYSRALAAAPDRRADPAMQRVVYNLGNTYSALGEVGPALETLDGALAGEDRDLAFRIRFNLGYMEYQRGRYENAAHHFVGALKVRPGDRDAKMNLELAVGKLQGGVSPSGESVERAGAGDQAIRILEYIYTKEEGVWESLEPDTPSVTAENW